MAITVRFRGGPVHDQLQAIEPLPVWRVPVKRNRVGCVQFGAGGTLPPPGEMGFDTVDYHRTDLFDGQGYVVYAVRGEPDGYTVCG